MIDTTIRLFFRWLRDYHTSVTVAARLTSQQEGTTNNLIVKGELAVHPSIHSPLTHSFIVNQLAGRLTIYLFHPSLGWGHLGAASLARPSWRGHLGARVILAPNYKHISFVVLSLNIDR